LLNKSTNSKIRPYLEDWLSDQKCFFPQEARIIMLAIQLTDRNVKHWITRR
jgi:hypothetical protein